MWQKKWLKRSIITISIFVIILTIAPVIIQYSITKILVDQGAKKADINDINLNIFDGSFELLDLTILTKTDEKIQLKSLSVDIEMLALFSSKVVIDQLTIKGINAHIQRNKQGSIAVNGMELPSTSDDSNKSTAETEKTNSVMFGAKKVSFESVNITYSEEGFSQKNLIQTLHLSNIKSWDPDSIASLKLNMAINQSPLILNTDLKLFNDTRHFKGDISLSKLDINQYHKFYRDHLNRLKGDLNITSTFDIHIESKSDQFLINAQIDKNIELSNLDLLYKQLHHSTGNISWKGKASYKPDGQINLSGNLDISDSQTIDTNQQYQLANIKQLLLSSFKTDLNTFSFEQLNLSETKIINTEKTGQFVSIERVLIDQFSFDLSANKLHSDKIGLSSPEIVISLNSDKEVTQLLPLLKTLEQLTPAKDGQNIEKVNTEEGNNQQPLKMSIGSIALLDPGKITFSDTGITPHYKSTFQLKKVNIQPVDSEKNSKFSALIQQGEYTLFDIEGDGLLFNLTDQLNLKADIKQLDLPPVTSYTSKAMGYGMKSGVVDSEINLTLIKRKIDSTVKLKIDSVEVVETNSDTAEQVSSASGMSIDLALSTLKDKHNVIELELPIQGNIDEPEFDISLIINKAMGKAMQSASLTYLKHALQPFGSLLTLYKLAKTAANHISLAPVQFETNSLDFKPEQQELLNKVASILKERPGVKIKACGISANADKSAIQTEVLDNKKREILKKHQNDKSKGRQQKIDTEMANIEVSAKMVNQMMTELADQRSAKVKAYFLKQANLKPARILNCLSQIITTKEGMSSVDLLI